MGKKRYFWVESNDNLPHLFQRAVCKNHHCCCFARVTFSFQKEMMAMCKCRSRHCCFPSHSSLQVLSETWLLSKLHFVRTFLNKEAQTGRKMVQNVCCQDLQTSNKTMQQVVIEILNVAKEDFKPLVALQEKTRGRTNKIVCGPWLSVLDFIPIYPTDSYGHLKPECLSVSCRKCLFQTSQRALILMSGTVIGVTLVDMCISSCLSSQGESWWLLPQSKFDTSGKNTFCRFSAA